ncbi:hypothetical protein BJX99DRAFT_219618 [Aspergillus californicus]
MAPIIHPARINMAQITDLPQELFDQIAFEASNSNRKRGTNPEVLQNLRQVNRAFYASASRLYYRSIQVGLKFNLDRQNLVPASLDALSMSQHRNHVENLVIHQSGPLFQPSDMKALVQRKEDALGSKEDAGTLVMKDMEALVLEKIPEVLARFPRLRQIDISLDLAGCEMPGLATAIRKSLQQNPPPQLEGLRIGLRPLALPYSPNTQPELKEVMPRLRYFKYDGSTERSEESNPGVFQALQHAEKLEILTLHKCGSVTTQSLTPIHPSAPLRYLYLDDMSLPAEYICGLLKSRPTLEVIKLNSIRLTEGTWAKVLDQLVTCPAAFEVDIKHCAYVDSQWSQPKAAICTSVENVEDVHAFRRFTKWKKERRGELEKTKMLALLEHANNLNRRHFHPGGYLMLRT